MVLMYLLVYWITGWQLTAPITLVNALVAAVAVRRGGWRLVATVALVLVVFVVARGVTIGWMELGSQFSPWWYALAAIVSAAPAIATTTAVGLGAVRWRLAPHFAALAVLAAGVVIMPLTGYTMRVAACMLGVCDFAL